MVHLNELLVHSDIEHLFLNPYAAVVVSDDCCRRSAKKARPSLLQPCYVHHSCIMRALYTATCLRAAVRVRCACVLRAKQYYGAMIAAHSYRCACLSDSLARYIARYCLRGVLAMYTLQSFGATWFTAATRLLLSYRHTASNPCCM